jgi:toxin ParE1/3/4
LASGQIKYYLLSEAADQDLELIFEYSANTFVVIRAAEYLQAFESLFQSLVINNSLGQNRDEIRKGLRSIRKESHIVFYRLKDQNIIIVRVLHVSRDFPRYFIQGD